MNKYIDISKDKIKIDDRFYLRFWEKNDLDDLHEMAKIEGVGENLGWKHSESIEDTEILLNEYLKNKCNFAIIDGKYEKAIGSLGIEEYTLSEHIMTFNSYGRELYGYISPKYWGNKIMSKAVDLVLNHSFTKLGLDFMIVGHFDDNLKSKKIAKNMGFVYLNTIDFETKYGKIVPTALYRLDKKDYLKNRKKDSKIDE